MLEKIPYYAFFQALSLQILLASLTLSLKNKCPCSFLCFLDKNDSKNLRIRKFWDLYEYEILNNAKKKKFGYTAVYSKFLPRYSFKEVVYYTV